NDLPNDLHDPPYLPNPPCLPHPTHLTHPTRLTRLPHLSHPTHSAQLTRILVRPTRRFPRRRSAGRTYRQPCGSTSAPRRGSVSRTAIRTAARRSRAARAS